MFKGTLVYSESDEAKAIVAEMRADGRNAAVRSPYPFKVSELEPCIKVVTWDAEIAAAYEEAGIPVDNRIEVHPVIIHNVIDKPKRKAK